MQEKIDSIIKKINEDPSFKEKFTNEPIKAVEELLGIDLPEEQINQIIDAVKAKLKTTDVVDKIKGLFEK